MGKVVVQSETVKGPVFQALLPLCHAWPCLCRRRSQFVIADQLRTRRPETRDTWDVRVGLRRTVTKHRYSRLRSRNGPFCRESLPYPNRAGQRDAFFEPFAAFDAVRPRRLRAYVDWEIRII